jgi:hypothetical protein
MQASRTGATDDVAERARMSRSTVVVVTPLPFARDVGGSGGAAVSGVVENHRGDEWAQEVVDHLGTVLADVDRVEPELLVEVFLEREHALHAPGLGRLGARGSGARGRARGARGGLGIEDGRRGAVTSATAASTAARRSNSASLIAGLTKPVRLSGPGIPPRRVLIAQPLPTRSLLMDR